MRTASFVLGLVGGILGILAAILAMFIGGVGSAFEASDSGSIIGLGFSALLASVLGIVGAALVKGKPKVGSLLIDRKSTRLNSSHVAISYAVFCLKNKNNK